MARLGDYVRIRTGKLDANASSENGQYPFFTCAIEPLRIDTYSYDCECVLVAGNGDLNVKYYTGKFNAYQRTYIIESLDKAVLSVPYLYCFLDKYVETLRQQAIGGVIKYIKLGNLSEADIPVPSIEEQSEIVRSVEKLNNLISLRKQQLTKLDELVKARFVEMFGDVKTNKFGWEKCDFDYVTTRITDGEHGTVPRVEKDEGYLYFMARNITKDGTIDLSETSYVPEYIHKKIYKRCNPEEEDILLVCVGATIGKSALVSKELGEFSMARSVALLKPDRKKVNTLFLLNLLRSDVIQSDIANCAHAAAQAGLYTNMIKTMDAFLPPIELQNQFADFVKQTDKSKLAVQQSLDNLELLKKALMQKYFG